ncbi:MAG: hypothetical protein QXU26_04320 [Thermofilaceae archaeon]
MRASDAIKLAASKGRTKAITARVPESVFQAIEEAAQEVNVPPARIARAVLEAWAEEWIRERQRKTPKSEG